MASGAGSWSIGRVCAWGGYRGGREPAQPCSRGPPAADAAATAGPRAPSAPGAAGTRGRGRGGARLTPRNILSTHLYLCFGGSPLIRMFRIFVICLAFQKFIDFFGFKTKFSY